MKDEIYYGNLAGILKTGRWSLNLEEASALLKIFQETQNRIKPADQIKVIDPEPIKGKPKPIKKAVKK